VDERRVRRTFATRLGGDLGREPGRVVSDELQALAKRLERLSSDPEHAAGGVKKIVAPVLRVLRWEPRLETAELAALVALLGGGAPGDEAAIVARLPAAMKELDRNISTLEQACAVDGHPPPAYVAWLRRMWKALGRVEDLLQNDIPSRTMDATLLAPPLVEKDSKGRSPGIASTVDPLIAAARAEESTLARRRRLLEAARQALLECAAGAALDPDALAARQSYIAREIALIDRLEAAGLSPRVSLIHQARTAVARGDVERAHAALVALDGAAARSGDVELGRLTGAALASVWKSHSPFSAEACAESLARSGAETFSTEVRDAVVHGLSEGRRRLHEAAQTSDPVERAKAQRGLERLSDGVEDALLLAALHVDGCFDVGGVLCPQRAVEEHRRIRQVTFPTQDMSLLPAHSVDDLRDAVVEDPRRIVHDFAAGRLLVRRYIAEETVRTERTVMRGEVRAYVLDGSGSMKGPRAHMRDAILLAELSTLMSRYADRDRRVQPVLHFRYFDIEPGPVTRVDSAQSALAAIENVVSTLHQGGTNIQRALVATFEDIRAARQSDPSLARAQIVLVTDGAAPVDRDAVLAARSAVGELPIGVSIIALGEENDALRELAAFQRSQGESVFYHFIPDGEIEDIVEGKQGIVSIHPPENLTAAELKRDLGGLMDEMEALRRLRETPRLHDDALIETAYDEVELSADDQARSATKARIALIRRDEAALTRMFDRWFPAPHHEAPQPREVIPPSDDAESLDAARAVLAAAAQVIDMVGSTSLERRIDAIEIVERLLFDAGIPEWHYAKLLRRYPGALSSEIERIRSVVTSGGD
jgi:hypothetical protein